MASGGYRFDRFRLDVRDRRLTRDGRPVELNPRYFDALALLVREEGRLVSKARFLEEVWRGAPVTDEALTQCVRTLRSRLGDDATRPRLIETVPKHGYRFIAPVEREEADDDAAPGAWGRVARLSGAAVLGGGAAGILGGLFYGLAGAAPAPEAGMGSASVMLVLVGLTLLIGMVGGAGVGLGVAVAERASGRPGAWTVLGGAVGGLAVGAVTKMLGSDAFGLLLGRTPGDITGGLEGAILGAAVGLGYWLAARGPWARSRLRASAVAGLAGAAAGALIPLVDGRLMAGSLDLLARRFPDSRLRLDPLGGLFGEAGFGPVTEMVITGTEGFLFAACVVGAMILARRRRPSGWKGA